MTTMRVPDAVEAINMDEVTLLVIVREDGACSLRGTTAKADVPQLLRLIADRFEER